MAKRWVLLALFISAVSATVLTEEDDAKNIILNYQTLDEPNREINMTNPTGLNVSKKTVFLVHGWIEDNSTNYYKAMFDGYMQKGGYNVIRVNWGDYAKAGYVTSKILITRVGNYIGKFIVHINQNENVPLKKIHIVGHSLGAQVAGIAGKAVHVATNETIARITGLDPAGPAFNHITPEDGRLDATDAAMVDCLYTNRNIFGTHQNLGTHNFYANGATSQPGCPNDGDENTSVFFCSHQRSTSLFAESINSQRFVAVKFDQWSDLWFKPLDVHENVTVVFGEDTNAQPGMYHFQTNAKKPYAMG